MQKRCERTGCEWEKVLGHYCFHRAQPGQESPTVESVFGNGNRWAPKDHENFIVRKPKKKAKRPQALKKEQDLIEKISGPKEDPFFSKIQTQKKDEFTSKITVVKSNGPWAK